MANVEISGLPNKATPLSSDEIELQATGGGASAKTSLDNLGKAIAGIFGSILVNDGATAQTGIGVTDVKVNGFALNGESSGVTPDNVNDKLTILTAGKYSMSAAMSFAGSSQETFDVHIAVDGISSVLGARRKLSSGGDVGNLSFAGYLDLAAAAEVSLNIKAGGAAKEITLAMGQLNVTKVG